MTSNSNYSLIKTIATLFPISSLLQHPTHFLPGFPCIQLPINSDQRASWALLKNSNPAAVFFFFFLAKQSALKIKKRKRKKRKENETLVLSGQGAFFPLFAVFTFWQTGLLPFFLPLFVNAQLVEYTIHSWPMDRFCHLDFCSASRVTMGLLAALNLSKT